MSVRNIDSFFVLFASLTHSCMGCFLCQQAGPVVPVSWAEEPSHWVTPAIGRHTATGKTPAWSCSGAQGMLTAGALGSDPGLLTQLWHSQRSQVPKPPEVQQCGGGRGVPVANLADRVNRYKIKQSAGLTGCHRVSFVDNKMAVRQVSKTLLGKRSFL